jgi:predicted MPP superfamily phosphohydrolase
VAFCFYGLVQASPYIFRFAGVEDWYSRHRAGGADLQKALAGRDPNKSLLFLAHQPAALKEAAAQNVGLQLSGHTHAGQIWPFGYLLYFNQPYAQGLHRYRRTSTQIYVSAGTGVWGPPMRLGTKSEITQITLHCN